MRVVPIPGDDQRVRDVIARLDKQQSTLGSGPVTIDPWEGGAVLNALLEAVTGVEIGPWIAAERSD